MIKLPIGKANKELNKLVKRTHNTLLAHEWEVTFHNSEQVMRMKYKQLSKYLSRKEMLNLYVKLKDNINWLSVSELDSNPTVKKVMGVM